MSTMDCLVLRGKGQLWRQSSPVKGAFIPVSAIVPGEDKISARGRDDRVAFAVWVDLMDKMQFNGRSCPPGALQRAGTEAVGGTNRKQRGIG